MMLFTSIVALALCFGTWVNTHKALRLNSFWPTKCMHGSYDNHGNLSEHQGATTTALAYRDHHYGFRRKECFLLQDYAASPHRAGPLRASKKSVQDGKKQNSYKPGNSKLKKHKDKSRLSSDDYRVQGSRNGNRQYGKGRQEDSTYHQNRVNWNNPGIPKVGIGPGIFNFDRNRNSDPKDRWLTKPSSDVPTDVTRHGEGNGFVGQRPYNGHNRGVVHYPDTDRNSRRYEQSPPKFNYKNTRGYTHQKKEQGRYDRKSNQWTSRSHEDFNTQVSKLNLKLARENQKIMRITTERINPLLNKVAHSNQKNKKIQLSAESQQKIKLMSKGGAKKQDGKEEKALVPNKSGYNSPGNKRTKNPKEQNEGDPKSLGIRDNNVKHNVKGSSPVYKGGSNERSVRKEGIEEDNEKPGDSISFNTKELQLMSTDVPGIRKLYIQGISGKETQPADNDDTAKGMGSLNRKILQLKRVGYNGIVDMNTLFSSANEVFQEVRSANDKGVEDTTFETLGIKNRGLVQALKRKGIAQATVTQGKYIPRLTEFFANHDVSDPLKCTAIHAPTGSGKTLTYMLPLLQRMLSFDVPIMKGAVNSSVDREQWLKYLSSLFYENVIVLSPSVELSVQSHMVLKELIQAYEADEGTDGDAKPLVMEDLKVKPSGFTDLFRSIGSSILERIRKPSNDESLSKRDTVKCSNEAGSMASSTIGESLSLDAERPKLKIITEIRPILLIGNANVSYQKSALKELKEKQLEMRRKAIAVVEGLYNNEAPSHTPPITEVRRIVGFMFATPGRAYSLWKTHKALDIPRTKFCVVDEYDAFLNLKRIRDRETGKEKEEVENPQVKAVLDAMLSKPGSVQQTSIGDAKSKYVLCLSASRMKETASRFGTMASVDFSQDSDESELQGSSAEYDIPKNILQTMCQYSVPDAKLAMLRKILKAVPYEKNALIFCDSNGTAEFLRSYLSKQFPGTDVTVLNCRQGKLERKKSFQNVLQSNIDTALRSVIKTGKGGSTTVRSIIISTQLNSRGIDFSGFSHVIHYDLPHDITTYLHRSGRIGRAGNPGICISLVESRYLPIFQRVICRHLPVDVHNIEVFKGHLCRRPLEFPIINHGHLSKNPKLQDFDWYGELEEFLGSFNRSLTCKEPFDAAKGIAVDPAKSVVINVGCGNSMLPFRLRDIGYDAIYNLDFCEEVLSSMRAKDKGNTMNWVHTDVSSEAYAKLFTAIEEQFQGRSKVIIDKAFLDAYISVGEGEPLEVAKERAKKYIGTTLSLMKQDDTFVILSLCQDYVVTELVRNLLFKEVYVDIHPLHHKSDASKAHLMPFLFLIYKRPLSLSGSNKKIKRRQCLMADIPNFPSTDFEVGSLPKNLRMAKGALQLGSNIQEYSPGRRITLDMYPKDFQSQVCFTAIIYDSTNVKDAHITTSAIIIPTGQEHFWQYSCSEGNQELASQAKSKRIIMLWLKYSSCGRISDGHSLGKGIVNPFDACFGDDALMSYIRENMGDMLLKLSLKGTNNVTILKSGESSAVRAPRRVGSSVHAGDIVIHDILGEQSDANAGRKEIFIRQMVFSCSPQTVQSELQYIVDESGKEIFLRESSPNEYITAIVLAMAFRQDETGIIGVLGSGSGTLPSLLRRLYKEHVIHAVDVDDTVVELSKVYFGYAPDETIQLNRSNPDTITGEGTKLIHISGDAADYIEYMATRNENVSCYVIDINNVLGGTLDETASIDLMSKDTLMSPHPKFLGSELLDCISSTLTRSNGILLFNVLTRSERVLDQVLHRLSSKFAWVGVLRMPEDINKVVVCLTRVPNMPHETFNCHVVRLSKDSGLNLGASLSIWKQNLSAFVL